MTKKKIKLFLLTVTVLFTFCPKTEIPNKFCRKTNDLAINLHIHRLPQYDNAI